MSFFSARNLVAGYQKESRVLNGIDFELDQGEIVALIGRNGMGKTTFLETITGHIAPSSGMLLFRDVDITAAQPYIVARAGIGYVPQGREIFNEFSVEQNLLMGAIGKPELANKIPDWAFTIFPVLAERRKQRAGTLSGGQQQQLAIIRALVGSPSLLLLDEPSEGIQPSIVQNIGTTMAKIAAESGLTILLVEQNLELAISLANRCVFMENGRIVEEVEDISRLRNDQELVHRYLSA
ncbi:MAG: ABC transporter ATP-binding protein [SAR324 cluster bacterium]|nr:ABC transporter ATP-binding protein [SAR324 cluster bacterium]